MKTCCSLLLLASACYVAAADPQTAWEIDSEPALTPGMIGEWDDFAITTPSVVRLPDKWLMLYEGINFTESGMHHAFGIAESKDGVTWTKHSQNPILQPEDADYEVCSAPSVAQWRNVFWCAYLVYSDPFRPDPTAAKRGDGTFSVRIARSQDGLRWSTVPLEKPPLKADDFRPLRPCLVAEKETLHLWWLDQRKEKSVLAHSVSRDGSTWSAPNDLPASEIDTRSICCARVYASGDFYILSYVVRDEKSPGYRVATKISNNARTWIAKGPPEFPLDRHEAHQVPLMMFETAGARLFFHEQRKDGTVALRTAFCRKEDYAGK